MQKTARNSDVAYSDSEIRATQTPVPTNRFDTALHALLSSIASEDYKKDPATHLLDILSQHLGTSSCHIVALETLPDGKEALVPCANSSRYTSLLSSMPPIPLDSPLDAARIFAEREPRFVQVSGADPPPEQTNGTARWREMISTASHATLPLLAEGDAFGVLTLQWAENAHFDSTARKALCSIATVIALLLSRERTMRSPLPDAPAAPALERRETLAVTALGAPQEEGGHAPETVLVADIEIRSDTEMVFEHLHPEGRPLRLFVLAPGLGADKVAPDARAITSTALTLSGSPEAWFASVNRALAENAIAGTGLHAWGATFDPHTGVLVEASSGTVSLLFTRPSGSEEQSAVKKLPLGLWSDELYSERPHLLLPGDTLEVCLENGPDLTLHFTARAPQ